MKIKLISAVWLVTLVLAGMGIAGNITTGDFSFLHDWHYFAFGAAVWYFMERLSYSAGQK